MPGALHDGPAGLGRAEEPFATGMLLPVHVGADAGQARSHAAARWAGVTGTNSSFPPELFVGETPAEIVQQLRTYWERGCSEMILALADQGDAYLGQLAALAEEVLPALSVV